MEKIMFIKVVLDNLSKEDFFKKTAALFIRILTALLLINALVSWIKLWKVVFDLSASALIGGIVFQLLFIIGMYMITHIMIIRTENILKLKTEKYYLFPLGATIIKMIGEIWASFLVFMGISGGILIWFAGNQSGRVIRNVPMINLLGKVGLKGDFLGGLTFMVQLIITGCIVIFISYLLSEGFKLTHGIEKNTRK
ncbi:hypothetical protein J7L48_07705 [bacterium]|nr:hypothetical protein [bacterium]